MNLNFAQVIASLGPDYGFKIASGARTPADYLFSTFLPERLKPTYDAKSGLMTVRSLMAGLSSKDSPYPPTGIVEASTFAEQTMKVANEARLTEAALRQLQAMLQAAAAGVGGNVDMAREALNFLNKVIIQSHMDTAEWLRGEALVGGAISWAMNDKTIAVDYGYTTVASGAGLQNLLTNRTGNDAYNGSASKFWDDIKLIRTKLRGGLRSIIAHPDTIESVMNNPVNAIRVIAQENGVFTFQRFVSLAGNTVASEDKRDTVTLIAYDKEGEVLDPANPATPIRVPFMSRGKLLATGRNSNIGYQVGMGSTPNPLAELELGYTHIAPTVEGNGQPGRWSRLYTPENQPMQLVGQGVTNIMPVIENPGLVVVASTDMP